MEDKLVPDLRAWQKLVSQAEEDSGPCFGDHWFAGTPSASDCTDIVSGVDPGHACVGDPDYEDW